MEKASHSARRPLVLPLAAGSVTARNSSGMRAAKSGLAHGVDGGDDLHQRLGRAAGFGDDDEARRLEVEPGKASSSVRASRLS